MGVETRERAPLSREQVLQAGLRYVNAHGLDALSMHKLGQALGVAAMSLYKHVANKNDLLDGIVEQLWAEIPVEPASSDWRGAVSELASALRDLVHRHPHAASLLTSRRTVQERMLRVGDTLLRMMRQDGVPEQCAVGLLRTVIPYGIGFALAELSFQDCMPATDNEVGRIRQVSAMLSPDASDDLVRTALLMCGDCDMNAQFDIGIQLMIAGLDACLANLPGRPCGFADRTVSCR
ncbi:MAG: TetR/AcrR family transcriptional regulator C-terminal domain-containing protein [Mycobacterium sp.]|nr:TetR/AcrR family transcriptional regulator C-terminal domain-containing protein [Mycobacterium sp.]